MNQTPLKPEKIKKNWEIFLSRIEKVFSNLPERKEKLIKMYMDFEEEIVTMPASPVEHFHNAIPGGYIDHVNRVVEYSIQLYKFYNEMGLEVDNFELSELIFAAINHDLGKIGFPGYGPSYKPNKSDWHVKNQGKIYTINNEYPFATVPDRSLYLLQRYGIQCSWNEYQGIKIHDGVYDDANRSYFISYKPESKLRNNLVNILHQADYMATRKEWETWAKESKSINFKPVDRYSEESKPGIESNREEGSEKDAPFGKFTDVFND